MSGTFVLANGDFFQDWSNPNLITTSNDWTGVPGIVGYTVDNANGTGVNPQTFLTSIELDANQRVIANSAVTSATGGIHEVPGMIAFQGSGSADVAAIVLSLDASGRQNLTLSALIKDLDTSTDNAVQQVAVQYRVGNSGSWINLPTGFVADATAPGTTMVETAITVTLPAAVNGQPLVQIRFLTTNAAGNDELVGIDDIRVTSTPVNVATPGTLSIADAAVTEGNAGTTDLSFTVNRTGGSDGAVSATWTATLPGGTGGASAGDLAPGTVLTGTVVFAAGQTSATITFPVLGDTTFEPDETFTVALSAPTGGALLGDAEATGTITNDDAAPPAAPANVFINEFHYDNTGTDTGEAIEIAGVAGTDLTGYKLVLYNGSNTPGAAPVYATVNLSGIIDNESGGYGALVFNFASNGIQNGIADGIALIGPDGTVIQFLSYEGVLTAAAGTPAAGLTSTDVGVSQGGSGVIGNSLAATGTGATGADFTFQNEAPNSFGSLNPGQTFIPDNGTGLISVADSSVIEGDSGISQLVFTVRRAGGLGQSASVDYAISLSGTANAADLAPGAVLTGTVTFAVGASSARVVVAVNADTVGEGNETLSLVLSNPVGNITIVDGAATGTIVNDDPQALTISQIQGEGQRSAFAGQIAVTTGVVTAVDTNGFFIQDPNGDGNSRTSDGIFVFTSTAPTVAVGDAVSVRAMVTEFQASPVALPLTELTAPMITVLSSGNALPAAVLIGAGGLLPPNTVIDDDGLTSYDPATDGIDFWESLEGMRVTIETPQAVSNTNGFGETDVVASFGVGATGINDRGGITISEGDFNPEKIQIDFGNAFSPMLPQLSIGDRLSSVTGVLNYAFNNYEVLITSPVTVTTDVTLTQEVTALAGDDTHLSLATYNLENLDPGDNKYALLAEDIVLNLRAPDIIGVQEIQDADGNGPGTDLSGQATAQGLIDAIVAAGGPRYVYIEVAPTTPNSTGGEPGGNIRNGFFYNPDRVSYIAGSATLLEGTAYNGTRKPLAADFSFNGQTFTAINVHFTSRGGSEPLWGDNQPPTIAGESARIAQAAGVLAFVNAKLATDPSLQFAVLGDFNGFSFEFEQRQLTGGGVFTDLNTLLPSAERYSFVFEGNAQALDHILVTGGLLDRASYDAVHLNSQLPGLGRPTDHDPQLTLLYFNKAPTALALDDNAIPENSAPGTVVGTLAATDSAGDTFTYALLDDAGGRFTVDAATGAIIATQAFDFETPPTGYAIVAQVTDQGGAKFSQGFTIQVTNLNEAPTAAADMVAVNEDATTANLYAALLGNDRDPDAGAVLTIAAVNSAGTLGSVQFDAATRTLVYVADADAFDALAVGATATDSFSYTVRDQDGLTSTATVTVTITGIADGVRIDGGNGADTVTGTGGEDTLSGGRGDDRLFGLGGHDRLDGGQGVDRLDGGSGNDLLIGGQGDDLLFGGSGRDVFVLGKASGSDTVFDFDAAFDRLRIDDGLSLKSVAGRDVDGDGRGDLVFTFSQGAKVTLLGVSDAGSVQIDYASAGSQPMTHLLGGDGMFDHLQAAMPLI